LLDVYTGPAEVLTGSARLAQEADDKNREQTRQQEAARLQAELERKHQELTAKILALQNDLSINNRELQALGTREHTRLRAVKAIRRDMQRSRQSDALSVNGPRTNHE
jgi:circadian clock protein KaiC